MSFLTLNLTGKCDLEICGPLFNCLTVCCSDFSLLPPASEGWGKVLFSVCLSVYISGGVPQLGLGEYPIPGLARGSTPSQVWPGGLPGIPPHDQFWMGYPLDLRWGTPRPGMGYPLDLRWGTPSDLGWGTPRT